MYIQSYTMIAQHMKKQNTVNEMTYKIVNGLRNNYISC